MPKSPGLKQALKAVNALSHQMTREAKADYGVALSASAVGQKNLMKFTNRRIGSLLADTSKQSASLSKLARQARARGDKVDASQQRTTNRYGAALGESVANSFSVAGATAGATGKMGTAAAAQGKAGVQTATEVAGVAKAGVRAQASAAKYSYNQALMARNIVDSQTIAQLTGTLYQSAMQYNQQLALAKQQQKMAEQTARKEALGQTQDTVKWLTSKGGEIGSWFTQAAESGQYVDASGKFDAAKALAAYKTENVLDPSVNPQDANTLALASATAVKIRSGEDPTTALTDATNEVFGGLQGWDRIGAPVANSMSGYTAAAVEANASSILQGITGVGYDPASAEGAGITNTLIGDNGSLHIEDATSTEMRDAQASALRNQYGASVARVWLRGQTPWSEDAINSYLANLPPDVAGTLQYSSVGSTSGYTTAPVTPATQVLP